VIRSRLLAADETLQRIRDESADRKVIGEAVALLACTNKFEFAVTAVFFSKLLSPLDTLTCSGTRLSSTHGYHAEPSCASMLV